MSAEDKKQTVEEHMKLLARRANVVRSRLLRAVDALDTRRHQVVEAGVHAKETASKVGYVLLGIGAVAAASVLALRSYLIRRRDRVLANRAKRFFGAFRVEKKPSFAVRTLERIVTTGLTVLATEATRRVTKNVVDGRLPDGRLAVAHAHHENLNPQSIG